jgi:hypothetical protein
MNLAWRKTIVLFPSNALVGRLCSGEPILLKIILPAASRVVQSRTDRQCNCACITAMEKAHWKQPVDSKLVLGQTERRQTQEDRSRIALFCFWPI